MEIEPNNEHVSGWSIKVALDSLLRTVDSIYQSRIGGTSHSIQASPETKHEDPDTNPPINPGGAV